MALVGRCGCEVCERESESVNLFQRFRAVFYRSPRLVRAWPASQAGAGFSTVKACLCVNTAGQMLLFFTVTSLVLVATCIYFFYSALFANGFCAKARRVKKRFVANLYWSCIACMCLLHAARLFLLRC